VENYRLRQRWPAVARARADFTRFLQSWPKELRRDAYGLESLQWTLRSSLCWSVVFAMEALLLLRQVFLQKMLSDDSLFLALLLPGLHASCSLSEIAWRRRIDRARCRWYGCVPLVGSLVLLVCLLALRAAQVQALVEMRLQVIVVPLQLLPLLPWELLTNALLPMLFIRYVGGGIIAISIACGTYSLDGLLKGVHNVASAFQWYCAWLVLEDARRVLFERLCHLGLDEWLKTRFPRFFGLPRAVIEAQLAAIRTRGVATRRNDRRLVQMSDGS